MSAYGINMTASTGVGSQAVAEFEEAAYYSSDLASFQREYNIITNPICPSWGVSLGHGVGSGVGVGGCGLVVFASPTDRIGATLFCDLFLFLRAVAATLIGPNKTKDGYYAECSLDVEYITGGSAVLWVLISGCCSWWFFFFFGCCFLVLYRFGIKWAGM